MTLVPAQTKALVPRTQRRPHRSNDVDLSHRTVDRVLGDYKHFLTEELEKTREGNDWLKGQVFRTELHTNDLRGHYGQRPYSYEVATLHSVIKERDKAHAERESMFEDIARNARLGAFYTDPDTQPATGPRDYEIRRKLRAARMAYLMEERERMLRRNELDREIMIKELEEIERGIHDVKPKTSTDLLLSKARRDYYTEHDRQNLHRTSTKASSSSTRDPTARQTHTQRGSTADSTHKSTKHRASTSSMENLDKMLRPQEERFFDDSFFIPPVPPPPNKHTEDEEDEEDVGRRRPIRADVELRGTFYVGSTVTYRVSRRDDSTRAVVEWFKVPQKSLAEWKKHRKPVASKVKDIKIDKGFLNHFVLLEYTPITTDGCKGQTARAFSPSVASYDMATVKPGENVRLTGTAKEGFTLTATFEGDARIDSVLTTEWYRGKYLAKEGGFSYQLGKVDVGERVKFVFRVIQSHATFEVTSPVIFGRTATVESVELFGKPEVGDVLQVQAKVVNATLEDMGISWYRFDDGEIPEQVAEGCRTYVPTVKDVDHFIRVAVYPHPSTTDPSDAELYKKIAHTTTKVIAYRPVIHNLEIEGEKKPGSFLTAVYDAEYCGGDSYAGQPNIQWFKSSNHSRDEADSDEEDLHAVLNATHTKYQLGIEDTNKLIGVSVTPIDKNGLEGEPVVTTTVIPASQPVASNVRFFEMYCGHINRVDYTFRSSMGGEGETKFEWAKSPDGTVWKRIDNPYPSYTPTADDLCMFVRCTVIPADEFGATGEPCSGSTVVKMSPKYRGSLVRALLDGRKGFNVSHVDSKGEEIPVNIILSHKHIKIMFSQDKAPITTRWSPYMHLALAKEPDTVFTLKLEGEAIRCVVPRKEARDMIAHIFRLYHGLAIYPLCAEFLGNSAADTWASGELLVTETAEVARNTLMTEFQSTMRQNMVLAMPRENDYAAFQQYGRGMYATRLTLKSAIGPWG